MINSAQPSLFLSRSGTYPTIGTGFKVEKYGSEAVRDVGATGAAAELRFCLEG